MLMSVLTHPSTPTKMQDISWSPEKVGDTLTVLQEAERRCRPDYNTVKVTKLDQTEQELTTGATD